MSIRLQVLMSEHEMRKLKAVAKQGHTSVGELVRRLIRNELSKADPPVDRKLQAIAKAMKLNGATGDIDQINKEIMEGYTSGLP